MFSKIGSSQHYIGPSFRACLHPATWATDQISVIDENGRKKTINVLRDSFKELWAYVEEIDVFICTEMPEILRSEAIFNKMVAGFSHVLETSKHLLRAYKGRTTKLCYRPDNEGFIVIDSTTSAINLHQPTTIKALAGDAGPWLKFLSYMFPIEEECKQVQRWCATLIARPEIKMDFGMLLVSEMQGIGKTTIAAKVLAPLVGMNNVGFPTEDDIVNSNFNGWLANKRLVVIGEIYSGNSWKAYNKLKSVITDKDVEVNQKYMRPYRVDNWAHILASSNSKKALRMEESDRRWFYPQVTEVPMSRQGFAEFNEWLGSGGLQIIHQWAKNFGDYVGKGERAPATKSKLDLIAESRSDAQQELLDFCDAVNQEEGRVFLAMKEVMEWLRKKTGAKVYDKDLELRKLVATIGWWTWPDRVVIGGQLQYVVGSPATRYLQRKMEQNDISNRNERNSLIQEMRKLIKNPENTGDI
jgi:hypothetical protein